MFPQVYAEEGNELVLNHAVHKWVVLVVRLSDHQTTPVSVCVVEVSQPHPPRSRLPLNCFPKTFLKSIQVLKCLSNRLCQHARGFVCRSWLRLQNTKQKVVVVDSTHGKTLRRFIKRSRLHVFFILFLVKFFFLVLLPNKIQRWPLRLERSKMKVALLTAVIDSTSFR